jgi:hypothetical protein
LARLSDASAPENQPHFSLTPALSG